MRLPGEFTAREVSFTTARTTPWEPKIETWISRPHITVECYNLWADEKYLGVIYESEEEDGVWMTLQLAQENYYPDEGEEWVQALYDYIANFTEADGLAIANG